MNKDPGRALRSLSAHYYAHIRTWPLELNLQNETTAKASRASLVELRRVDNRQFGPNEPVVCRSMFQLVCSQPLGYSSTSEYFSKMFSAVFFTEYSM